MSKKVSLNDLFSMVTFLRLFPLNPFALEAFQIEGAGRAPNDGEMLLKVLEAEAGLNDWLDDFLLSNGAWLPSHFLFAHVGQM